MTIPVKFLPMGREVAVEPGTKLVDAARFAGISIDARCGGTGRCGRCKCTLIKGTVPELRPGQILSESEIRDRIVPACMVRVLAATEIELHAGSWLDLGTTASADGVSPGRKIVEPKNREQISPLVHSARVTVDQPSLEDNTADLERLQRAMERTGVVGSFTPSVSTLRDLAAALRADNGRVRVTVAQAGAAQRILSVEPGFPSQTLCGLAVDMGTTTVAATLIDLDTTEVLGFDSDFNGQITCGEDVIHRIVYAAKPGGREELRCLGLDTVNALVSRLSARCAVSKDRIGCAFIAGNTTMAHLLLGLDPRHIREEPYIPTVGAYPPLRAEEVGVDMHPTGVVVLAPSVGSWVGGDVTAGVLYSGLYKGGELTLYVDFGTNGEIVLGNRDWMMACACSAGPAFEGGGITCGMRAVPGAIDKVEIGDPHSPPFIRTIAGQPPTGICGAGLIDLVSTLFYARIVDRKGRFQGTGVHPLVRNREGQRGYIVVDAEETAHGRDIFVTEADLGNILRAKGAMWAGIRTTLTNLEIEADAIERIVIAGGFGAGIDIAKAISIGMLPDRPPEIFSYIGNGSLQGAALAMVSENARAELREITARMTYLELSAVAGYMDEFMASVFLPHTDLSLFPSARKTTARKG